MYLISFVQEFISFIVIVPFKQKLNKSCDTNMGYHMEAREALQFTDSFICTN
jgi:hypothetical protein